MQFFTRLYFYTPAKDAPKKDLFIAASSIDFLSWFKKDLEEGPGRSRKAAHRKSALMKGSTT